MYKKLLLFLMIFILFFPVMSNSQETKSVTVAWDYPLQTSLTNCISTGDYCPTGFSIFSGSSARPTDAIPPNGYSSSLDIDCSVSRDESGIITSVSCTPLCLGPGTASDLTDPTSTECRTQIVNLQEGQTYYLTATAYSKDSTGQKVAESLYSNEISYTVPLSKFTITSSAGSGGTIQPLGATEYDRGSSATYSIVANTGYNVSDVIVDGTSVGSKTSHTFSDIQANHTISASFLIKTFTITASAGVGGSISPSGVTTVNYNASQTYNITPASGYIILDVKVDGVSQGALTTYTFAGVASNRTISVTFDLKRYNIVASSSSGGSITPSGNVSVPFGSTQTFSITANSGYRIASVSVDGTNVGNLASYTFNSVSADHTISASFIRQFVITASAGSGGSITPTGNVYVDEGGNATFTITPNSGYRINSVSVDSISIGSPSTYTFSGVVSPHSIDATFMLIPIDYTITLKVNNAGGAITGPTTVTSGSNAVYNFTVYEGYKCQSIKLDGVNIGCVSSYELTNVQANHTIELRLSPPKPKNLRR